MEHLAKDICTHELPEQKGYLEADLHPGNQIQILVIKETATMK